MGQTTSLANEIFLDVSKAHVVFIVGKRGSGKSYTMGAFAEGIMGMSPEISQNLSMIMLDTMGIYWTMKYPNRKTKEVALLEEWGLEPKGLDVQIFTPTGMFERYKEEGVPTDFAFSIKPKELDSDDWCMTFDIDRNSDIGVFIAKIINFLKENKDNYSLKDIIDTMDDDDTVNRTTKEAAKNRFMTAETWGLFDVKGTKLNDLVVGGKISVLDVSAYATMPNGWAIKSLVIGLIAKKLFIQRMKARREEEFSDIETKMAYFRAEEPPEKRKEPLVWIVIDEAHEFLPFKGKTTASDALITILREGRQPGISLVLASQQPGKISTDVMTQSDIFIAHRLTARLDIEALEHIAQSYLRAGIAESINKLPGVPGSAIILDDSNERIYPAQIRPRITWHGGEAPVAIPEKKETTKF
ncbi:DUF87 domain-containing protein [Candidatus Woesearchaeota archaeon]|nr:DUF87 domain-containing protein [Candidatus Woesearchaeota archaeon]